MSVYKIKDGTKDGRNWYYRTYYHTIHGEKKQKKSIKYFTKKEAEQAEREFLLNNDNFKDLEIKEMNFEELIDSFVEYNKDKVKIATQDTYNDKRRYLESIKNIKTSDFDIKKFEKWKKEVNSKNIGLGYKNDIYKFLRSVINYGVKIQDLDFSKVYNKMTNFKDPNEIKKEMVFFTYDEFNKYISVIEDLQFRTLYKTLYYCGLRKGELKGLTWEDIDFDKRELSVNKQVVNIKGEKDRVTSPKTKTSYRTLPITNKLLIYLKKYYILENKN